MESPTDMEFCGKSVRMRSSVEKHHTSEMLNILHQRRPQILLRMTMSMLMTILIIMKMMMVVLRMTTTIMTVIAVIITI